MYNFVPSLNTAKNTVKPYIIGSARRGGAIDTGAHTMGACWQLNAASNESRRTARTVHSKTFIVRVL